MADRSSPAATTPIRTCVGCRRKDRPDALLRVVLDRRPDPTSGRDRWMVVADPAARLPGRGAWIHQQEQCLRTAEQRQAFPRALRASGSVDTSQLWPFVSQSARTEHDERAGDQS